jgi:HD-GYP domain-containing protein (c-di-GMP phosphodiesterase class II)
MLATFAAQAGTAVTLARSIREEHDQYVGLVKTMLSTLDARDPYTAGHSERVGEYTRRLARALGWNEIDQERALFAGWVHDIGKIGIRDHYLYKEGRLTPEERRTVRQHSVIGERILRTATRGFEEILPAVRNHHERWDGNGYPDGLSGQDIPLLARMVGLSDAFDAMTSSRPYAQRRSWPEAFQVLQHEAGYQFDPTLVPVFVELLQLDVETINFDFTDLEPRDPTTTPDAERNDWSTRTIIDETPAPIVMPPEPPSVIRIHRDPELDSEPILEIENA